MVNPNSAVLTDEQKSFYKAFGFLVLRQFLSPDEMQIIDRAFEAVMVEARGGKPFDGRKSQSVPDAIDKCLDLRTILPGDSINGVTAALLGPGSFPTGSGANLFVGGTLWHPDHGWDPHFPDGKSDASLAEKGLGHFYRGVAAALYLDPVGKDSGCLRFIPGSHLSPYHEALGSLHCDIPGRFEHVLEDPRFPNLGVDPSEIPAFAAETEPGDVVCFSHQVWHATFGGKTGRRFLAMEFKAAPSNDLERQFAKRYG